jgi:hypothetical protein
MVCEHAKNGAYVARGKYGKYAKEAAFVKEGDNKPFVKGATTSPLPPRETGLDLQQLKKTPKCTQKS